MSKHTTGQWDAVKSANGRHYTIRPSPSSHLNLAVVKPLLPSEGGAESTEANAQLMAAAPELLEVAEEARERLLQYAPVNMAPPPHNSAYQTAERLEAAIAKARGHE